MGNKTDLACTAGGMLSLLAGGKFTALGLFAKGLTGLEKKWRNNHPDFDGSASSRWKEAIEFYDKTHREPTNRKLHKVGIPMILGGTVGLLLFPAYRPFWTASAGLFAGGWVLNFIGHGIYEKNKPAFADDPLSFIAGPVWDWKLMHEGDEPSKNASNPGNFQVLEGSR